MEMGAYAVILQHTPDHEDLITSTDNEVFCRLVDRWVGQGGKTSLANTEDADILEYILAKLTARIVTKVRTTTHPHYDGSPDASDRPRMGGRGCPAGLRTTVSQRKGVDGILDLETLHNPSVG